MSFEIGELVKTQIGIGTVEGQVRLRGRIRIMVSFMPEELREADNEIHGMTQLYMFPEENIEKVEKE